MALRDFIRENVLELDLCIIDRNPNCGKLNDEMRRLWVLQDKQLSSWARSEGVNI